MEHKYSTWTLVFLFGVIFITALISGDEDATNTDNYYFDYLAVLEEADYGNVNRNMTNATNKPLMRVYSKDETNPMDYIQMRHTGISGRLETGDGGMWLTSTNYVALLGGLGQVMFGQNTTVLLTMDTDTDFNQVLYGLKDETGNQFLIVHDVNPKRDFGHTPQPNPTLYIHSNTHPFVSTAEWVSLSHNNQSAYIETGKGDIVLNPESNMVKIPDNLNVTGTIYYGALQANSPILHKTDNEFVAECTTASNGDFVVEYIKEDKGTYTRVIEKVDKNNPNWWHQECYKKNEMFNFYETIKDEKTEITQKKEFKIISSKLNEDGTIREEEKIIYEDVIEKVDYKFEDIEFDKNTKTAKLKQEKGVLDGNR